MIGTHDKLAQVVKEGRAWTVTTLTAERSTTRYFARADEDALWECISDLAADGYTVTLERDGFDYGVVAAPKREDDDDE